MAVERFLYYDDVYLTASNIMSVLYGSKKYLVSPLTAMCLRYLESAINLSDVCTILEQSVIFSEDELKNKCLAFIRKNTRMILNSDGFKEIQEDTLKLIVRQEELNVREVELFQSCVDWARGRSGKDAPQEHGRELRKALEGVLQHIRFLTMSLNEFANTVVPSNLLTVEETCEVYKYFTCNDKPHAKFSVKKRMSDLDIIRAAHPVGSDSNSSLSNISTSDLQPSSFAIAFCGGVFIVFCYLCCRIMCSLN